MHHAPVYWVQSGMAFSVYPDRPDAVFDLSRDETSVYYDILAIREFIGDKSREIIAGSNECIAGAGVAFMRDRLEEGYLYIFGNKGCNPPFMRYLDERIQQIRPWLDGRRWLPRHLSVLGIQQIAFSP